MTDGVTDGVKGDGSSAKTGQKMLEKGVSGEKNCPIFSSH